MKTVIHIDREKGVSTISIYGDGGRLVERHECRHTRPYIVRIKTGKPTVISIPETLTPTYTVVVLDTANVRADCRNSILEVEVVDSDSSVEGGEE